MMSNEELKRGVTFDEILRMFKYPPYDKEEEPQDDNHYHPGGFVDETQPMKDEFPTVVPAPPLEYLEGLQ